MREFSTWLDDKILNMCLMNKNEFKDEILD